MQEFIPSTVGLRKSYSKASEARFARRTPVRALLEVWGVRPLLDEILGTAGFAGGGGGGVSGFGGLGVLGL